MSAKHNFEAPGSDNDLYVVDESSVVGDPMARSENHDLHTALPFAKR